MWIYTAHLISWKIWSQTEKLDLLEVDTMDFLHITVYTQHGKDKRIQMSWRLFPLSGEKFSGNSSKLFLWGCNRKHTIWITICSELFICIVFFSLHNYMYTSLCVCVCVCVCVCMCVCACMHACMHVCVCVRRVYGREKVILLQLSFFPYIQVYSAVLFILCRLRLCLLSVLLCCYELALCTSFLEAPGTHPRWGVLSLHYHYYYYY